MTLWSLPRTGGIPVRYVHSPLRFVCMKTDDEIVVNGDQPTRLVMRLNAVCALLPDYGHYPECVRCGKKVVATDIELWKRLLTGEVGGICHICDPGNWPGYRTHYYEARYERAQ